MSNIEEKYLTEEDPRLSYIPPTDNPLSANVVLIRGDSFLWLYDMGASPDVASYIQEQGCSIRAVISHFHPDHMANISRLSCDEIYQGKNTYGYTHRGVIIDKEEWLTDGDLRLHLFPVPSSHAKGSLALEVNETWCFLGDAPYATRKNGRTVYNTSLLLEQIRLLKKIQAPYFLISHNEPFLQKKEDVMEWLEGIAALRKPTEAYIECR